MTMSHVIVGSGEGPAHLAVRTVSFADLKAALAKGLDDFSAMPSHAVFLCLIYPIAGLVLGPEDEHVRGRNAQNDKRTLGTRRNRKDAS